MNEVVMLRGAEPRKILQTIVEKEIPAIMSYLSRGKWHVAKVLLTNLGASRLDANPIRDSITNTVVQKGKVSKGVEVGTNIRSSGRRQRPMNIQVNQPVGISIKYEYSKFIFDTTVIGFEPPPKPAGPSCDSSQDSGFAASSGVIVLAVPDRIEIVQRRSYFRVSVPEVLKVNVALWHRCYRDGGRQVPPEHYWTGRLVDISAGGAQIAVDTAQKPDFKKGQFIGLRFTPMPYETPLVLSAQIRSVLTTADGKSICFGLQMVGLEASPEGRGVLQRLCNIVECYYQMSQSGVKQQDFQMGPRLAISSSCKNRFY